MNNSCSRILKDTALWIAIKHSCTTSSISRVGECDEPSESKQEVNINYIGSNFVKKNVRMEPLCHGLGLQLYILLCLQDKEGGIKDKPGMNRLLSHVIV